MNKTYHLDFETFSPVDLRKTGEWRYGYDPGAEVLCASISTGDHPPILWLPPAYSLLADDPAEQKEAEALMLQLAENQDSAIYAHNAAFEYAIWQTIMHGKLGFKKMNPERMRCTATMARRACIPASLEKCAEYLGIDQQKDKKGAALIRKFCVMQKPDKHHTDPWRRFPADDPAEFRQLCNYCVQDTRTEVLVAEALKNFDVNVLSRRSYTNTLIVNEIGFPVDTEALAHAQVLAENHAQQCRDEFTAITGFNPTQTKLLLPWLQERGYKGTDLRASTMGDELADSEDMDEDLISEHDVAGLIQEARRALQLRKDTSFAAVKKLISMQVCAGPHDNRVRGTLLNHGASTGRWSSKLVQQQNMKRSTIADSKGAFKIIQRAGTAQVLELIYGPCTEVLSSCVRHFINDGDQPLDSVDYSAVEARIVCWLAGQEDAIQEFSDGIDRYKVMASRIFRVGVGHVTKDQRFVGKQTVLGCGFGMGPSKFQDTCASHGQQVSMQLAEGAVGAYRKAHPRVVALWYKLESACRQAIVSPGNKFQAGRVSVFAAKVAGKLFLFIKLPSGRLLAYPEPQVTDGKRITFYGQIQGKAAWGRIDTYGGKLTENITQAVAADCMAVGLDNALRAGHQVIMLVHDEAVRTVRGSGLSREHFEKCLLSLPNWADGLPLGVEGSTIEFYTK